MRRVASITAALAVLMGTASAGALPDAESTNISIFAGGRYVLHSHFEEEAKLSGTPVTSDSPIAPQAMLSFAYLPESWLSVSLEAGYSLDSIQISTGNGTTANIGVTSIPIEATVRFMPFDTFIYPYGDVGGGYMLNFLAGVPSNEVEAHTKMGHVGIGVAWPFAPRWTLYAEDRFELSLPDIVPIGELNAGGNVLMIGLGFNMAPEAQIAPH